MPLSLSLPITPAEISADWLSDVLGEPVAGVSVVDAHDGTTGRAVLALERVSGSTLPSRLFVKLPPGDAMQRAFVVSSGMGRREAMFYQQLSAQVPVRVPHCYYAATDESGEPYIMLLEDLEAGGCSFRTPASHASIDYIERVLACFARLHASFWSSPRFEQDLSWVEPPLQHPIAVDLIAVALEQHAQNMPPVFRAFGELYLKHTDAIHALWHRGEHTLIHGDVHDGNLFADGAEPGFLDWALLAKGPAMRDVGYFLAGTLRGKDREEHQRPLLAYYQAQLQANGVAAPAIEALWQQYQWHAAYVWVGAAVTLAMGDAWQPVNYSLAALQKIHAAMDSIGSVGAIEEQVSG